MTRPERMSKLLITGPRTHFQKIIDALHQRKVLHIIDHQRTEELDIGTPVDAAATLSEILVKVRALASHLTIDVAQPDHTISRKYTQLRLEQLRSVTGTVHNDVMEQMDALKAIDENIRSNEQKSEDLSLLKHLPLDLDAYATYRTVRSFVGFVNPAKLEETVSSVTSRYELFTAPIDRKELVALFVDTAFAEKMQEALQSVEFTEFSLAAVEGMRGSPQKHIKQLSEQTSALRKQRQQLEKRVQDAKRKHADFLVYAEHYLSIELTKAQAPLRCGTSKNFFVIRGFVPRREVEEVAKELYALTNKKISIKYDTIDSHEPVPIKLNNSALKKPFEFFLHMYTLPNYRELDPTAIMFWTFPLLFGFILGDIGYGLTTLLLFWLLKKKFKAALFDIGIYASLGSVFFGVLFGEIFGEEVLFGHHLPHILSRAHDLISLLYLAVAVGIVHLNMGLLLGFYTEWKHHGFMTAVYEKASWIVLQAGIAVLALSYMNITSLPVAVGYGVIGLGVMLLYKGEGVLGLIELPSILSNTLSYARLMAVGLSSVLIAVIVNEFAGEFFHQGGAMIIAGVALLIVGHTINIGLGLLGGFLHSLRLHYVEFFGKFYKGGGKKYVPFGTGG